MAQDKKPLPPTEGYDVEFIPLERRTNDQRRQKRPSPDKLPAGISKERRKKERRQS